MQMVSVPVSIKAPFNAPKHTRSGARPQKWIICPCGVLKVGCGLKNSLELSIEESKRLRVDYAMPTYYPYYLPT